jgi:hypothetical protein
MTTNIGYIENKKSLKSFDIHLNDNGKNLGNSIFIGCQYGLYIKDKLACCFPYFSAKSSELAKYRSTLKEAFSSMGVLKKIALYLDKETNVYFAVPNLNRVAFNMSVRDSIRDNIYQFKPKLYRTELKIEFEDTNFNDLFGVLDNLGKQILFRQMIVFDGNLIDDELKRNFITVASFIGMGDYTTAKRRYENIKNKELNINTFVCLYDIDRFPDHISKRVQFKEKSLFGYYEKAINNLSYFKSLKRKESVFINNRFIKLSIHLGDELNYEWFGREFGFFLKVKYGGVVRFFSESYSDKGIVKNMADVN